MLTTAAGEGIPALVDRSKAAGLDVALTTTPDLGAVDPMRQHAAYRLVQEGLTNATRHAPGAPVCLRLDRTAAGELHVWLRNPLRTASAPLSPGARAGLVGLTERIGLVGGRLDHGVRRDPDGALAFHLEGWLPWPT